MKETEKKSIVKRLIDENKKLQLKFDKQNSEVNTLLDIIWKFNENKESPKQ